MDLGRYRQSAPSDRSNNRRYNSRYSSRQRGARGRRKVESIGLAFCYALKPQVQNGSSDHLAAYVRQISISGLLAAGVTASIGTDALVVKRAVPSAGICSCRAVVVIACCPADRRLALLQVAQVILESGVLQRLEMEHFEAPEIRHLRQLMCSSLYVLLGERKA